MKTSSAGIRVEFSENEMETVNEMEIIVRNLLNEMTTLASKSVAGSVCEIDFGNGNTFDFNNMGVIQDFVYYFKHGRKCEIHCYD